MNYNALCFKISRLIIKNYSTSFFFSTRFLEKNTRQHISNIYAFVRLADEIVDTFHNHNKPELLQKFINEYYDCLKYEISLNPVIHAFVKTIKQFKIPDDYVEAFLNSMTLDLNVTRYTNKTDIDKYIYGSAEVVGLICLKIFCNNDEELFSELKTHAIKLGAAFQKVNFLRDLKNDTQNLGRYYFPELSTDNFNDDIKNKIVKDIEADFAIAFKGIKKLPDNSKLAVLIAYTYYTELLKKIKNKPSTEIINKRVRISNLHKILLAIKAILMYKLKIV